MQDFRKLEIWSLSLELTKDIYKISSSFPKEEIYSLTSQIRRCANSVPANIAEGTGRRTKPDFIHFIHIAIGSLSELESHIELAKGLKYIKNTDADKLIDEIDKIRRKSINFIKSIKSRKT